MRKCKFLSKPIYVDPSNLEKYVEEQNNKFIESFVSNTTYFKGLPIKVEHLSDNNDYGTILNNPKYKLTSFAHLVSKKINKNTSKRDLDIQRLKSCNWAKELIDIYNSLDASCHNNCQYFKAVDDYDRGHPITYIYCRTVRYVVILEQTIDPLLSPLDEGYKYYFIKTAFYVDEESMHLKLMRKF